VRSIPNSSPKVSTYHIFTGRAPSAAMSVCFGDNARLVQFLCCDDRPKIWPASLRIYYM